MNDTASPAASAAYLKTMRFRQLLFTWSGPAFVVVFFIGLILFMGFVPPQSPLSSGQQIADVYIDNLTNIRIGIVLCCLSASGMMTWGAVIAARTKRTEREFPVYTYTQIASMGVGVMVGVFCFVIFAIAAFRPDEIAPDITRMLNDLGWFLFLFDVGPFIVWMIAVGLAILTNESDHSIMPRWAGYFSLWCAAGEAPAVLILFFKDGPFAFNGLIGFWLPLIAFFAWIVVLSFAMHKQITATK